MSIEKELIFLRRKALEYRRTSSAMFFPSYAIGFLNSLLEMEYGIKQENPDESVVTNNID